MATKDDKSVTVDITQMPALYVHCKTVYKEMHERSDTSDSNRPPVYIGFLTQLFSDLGLSVPYYTSVMGALKRMGCVEQTHRGGGGGESEWEILNEPTKEAFLHYEAPVNRRPTRLAQSDQRIRDLTTRVDLLEKLVVALQSRLDHVDREFTSLKEKVEEYIGGG